MNNEIEVMIIKAPKCDATNQWSFLFNDGLSVEKSTLSRMLSDDPELIRKHHEELIRRRFDEAVRDWLCNKYGDGWRPIYNKLKISFVGRFAKFDKEKGMVVDSEKSTITLRAGK